MTTKKLTEADVQRTASEMARGKILNEPARFRKIADPAKRMAAARREVYGEHPVLVEADRTATG